MSFVLTVVLSVALNVPASGPALIKHAARLDTRQWRVVAGQAEAQDRKPGEERGVDGAFESDMRLTSQQMADILHQQQAQEGLPNESAIPGRRGRFRRKAVAHDSYLWSGRTVPYQFHHSLPEYYKDTILEALDFWQRSTCIKFVPFSKSMTEYLRHMDYVLFTVGEGCQSSIGRVGLGLQSTEIAAHCNEFGSVAHEIGHILGFYHEQSRPDRDNYVTILRHNIRPGRQHNFLKYSSSEIITKEPYDIGSVMHYGPTYFSKDGGSRTIETRDETYRAVMGQRNAPSFIDVKTANDMYRCNEGCDKWPKCENMGYVGPDCTCMCPTGLGGWDCTDVKASTADCGGVLADPTGTIVSPGYGFAYDNNVDCLWLIQGPRGTRSISLTTELFELEDDTVQPCAFDWLEVRTLGPHLNGQRFCGEGPTGDIVYHGDALVLHFHSDNSYTFSGFNLHYVIHGDVGHDVSKLEPLFSDYAAEDTGFDYDATPLPQEYPNEPVTGAEEPPGIDTDVTDALLSSTDSTNARTWTAAAVDSSTTHDPLEAEAAETEDYYDYDNYHYYGYGSGKNDNADELVTAWSEWSPCTGPRCDTSTRWRFRACRTHPCGNQSPYEEEACNTSLACETERGREGGGVTSHPGSYAEKLSGSNSVARDESEHSFIKHGYNDDDRAGGREEGAIG